MCCFSAADYRAMPMWAYYANCSKGLCVEYNVIDPSDLCEVFYESKPQEVTKTTTNLLLSALNEGTGVLTEDKKQNRDRNPSKWSLHKAFVLEA